MEGLSLAEILYGGNNGNEYHFADSLGGLYIA